MQQSIKESIESSKVYKKIDSSIIDETIEKETPKYKKSKDIEQSVRKKLHTWVSMFFLDYQKLQKEIESSDNIDELLPLLLQNHVSTKERLDFISQMIKDIDMTIPGIKSILDLGCGLNPIAYFLYSGNKNVKYTAVDVEKSAMELLNLCFSKMNANAQAFADDVKKVQITNVDAVFMFKLLPLLEQQEKGASEKLINKINSKYYCISFPTKSMSGKNVGMYNKYKSDIDLLASKCNLKTIFEKEYKNEILFILQK